MYLQPLQPVARSEMEAIGDVKIDPTAEIAMGVILIATPNSKIAIEAGVCIGMGAILQAHGGTITIKSGAILGAGVLVVGKATIGTNACIGAATTIYNASIEPLQIVPAGSVIGDESRLSEVGVAQEASSRQAPTSIPPEAKNTPYAIDDPEPQSEIAESRPELKESASQQAQEISAENSANSGETAEENSGEASGSESEEIGLEQGETTSPKEPETSESEESGESVDGGEPEDEKTAPTIYGQLYVSRMLGTLFPRGQSLNSRKKE